jgi:hypothetical protein
MHEYTIELRIRGENLDPLKITRELGVRPSTVRRPGDMVGLKTVSYGEWGYNGSDSDDPPVWESLEDGLAYVLGRIQGIRPHLETYRSTFDMFWWCGHFQSSFDGGPTLSPALLRELADFGIPLFIDNYFSEDHHC